MGSPVNYILRSLLPYIIKDNDSRLDHLEHFQLIVCMLISPFKTDKSTCAVYNGIRGLSFKFCYQLISVHYMKSLMKLPNKIRFCYTCRKRRLKMSVLISIQ